MECECDGHLPCEEHETRACDGCDERFDAADLDCGACVACVEASEGTAAE